MKLYKAGWGFTADSIEDSVREGLEELKLQTNPKDPDEYITFEEIKFERRKGADASSALKDAVIHNKSILTKITGNVIKHKDGKRSTLARGVQLGHLPHMVSGRNSFVVHGSEYNIVNQTRRNSSAYVSTDINNKPFAEFNLAKGRNFDITLDDHTRVFSVEIGTSKVVLKALLEVLEISAQEFKAAVGDKLYQANWTFITDNTVKTGIRRLYKKLYEYLDEDVASMSDKEVLDGCRKYYKTTKVDPVTTAYLYDEESHRVDKTLVLNTLKKFMAVADGKASGVDVDDLYYQKLYTPNLLFKDRITKLAPEIANKVRFKLKHSDDHKKTFENVFSRPLVSMANTSNLSRLDPQYNPLGIFSSGSTVTPLGMGGIQDIQAVRRSTRGVHNSYLGVIDPIASPQGQNSGIQSKLADGVRVDKEGGIYLELKNRKGVVEHKKLTETFNYKILLPGQQHTPKKYVLHRGQIVPLVGNAYDYELAKDTESMLNDLDKLVPFPQAVQGNRNYMTYRFLTQAMPVKNGEVPNVLPVNYDGVDTYTAMREKLSELMPYKAPATGTIKKITDEDIIIQGDDGKTYEMGYHQNLPFATNTGLTQEPIVKVGDHVKKGQIILKDEYTNDKGQLAMGVNLRTAFTPYYGYNSEDAVVISEEAAKKLTSIHYYNFQVSPDDTKMVNKKKFRDMFSHKYDAELFDKLDDDGVVKKGTQVNYGDILIAVVEKRTPDDKLSKLGKISRNIVLNMGDGAEIFKVRVQGTVTEVVKTPKLISVTVKTEEAAEVGDKVSGLVGNKGIISKIVPTSEMLQDSKKRPIDIAWSSTVVVSRMNPAQIHENSLGKIVQEKGLPQYRVPILKNQSGESLHKWVSKELAKHGVKDKERVFDPIAGDYIKRPVAVGSMYTLKLLKGDKSVSARSIGPSYTASEIPSKGGKEGAKALGAAEFNALVAHNARTLLSEASSIKSQKVPDFWRNMELGLSTPVRGNSFAWDKLKGVVTAAGGYIEQSNQAHQIVPVTDKLTDRLAQHRVLKTPAMLKAKSLEPMKNGLFDPKTVGGLDGKLWSKIELHDGIVSPLVADYVKLALGMKADEFKAWERDSNTAKMKKDLKALDTAKILRDLKAKSKGERGLTNNEVKLYRFLTNLEEKDIKIEDLVITSIPVPPPIYRPLTKLENGEAQLADMNLFYKDVMLANEALPGLEGSKFKPEAKHNLITSIDALVGKIDPVNIQLKNKGARGILAYVGGVGSPKNGFIHSTMLKKNQDLTGRARIIPDAKMDPDTVGVPEKIAWKIYEPHLRAELMKMGRTSTEAQDLITKHDPMVRNVLVNTMDKMHILINRNPTLHRYGMLAAKPKLISGDSVAINMFSTNPLNADFDGDEINLHVPATAKGGKELENYMLSKMPFEDLDIDSLLYKLTVEAILGFYQMSKEEPAKVKKDIKAIIPDAEPELPLTKKNINKLLVAAAKNHPAQVAKIFLDMKNLGETYATHIGSTVGMDDIAPMTTQKNILVAKYNKHSKNLTGKERIIALEKLQKDMIELASTHKGDLAEMVQAGAKGKSNQLSGIVASPVLAYDPDHPLDSVELTSGNFSDGLDTRDFWLQNAKARKDLVATALNVSVPGSLGKLMTANVNREVISINDCKTRKGIEIDASSPDILGRILQEELPRMKKGTAITTENRKKLPARKIMVRSPLTCEADHGVCQLCYGVDSHWKLIPVGTNVGLRAAQSISQIFSQSMLDSKHGGRSITKDIGGGGMVQLQSVFSSDVTNPRVAMLATEPDEVSKIEDGLGGITVIHMVDGTTYNVPAGAEILVKKGDTVRKGDKLTAGVLPFTQMTELKGINSGRQTLSGELHRIMGESGGRVHSRMSELISKGAINTIEFKAPYKNYIPGDTMNYNKFKGLCEEVAMLVSMKNIVPGMILADEYEDYSAGHKLSQADIAILRRKHDKIKILPDEIRVEPTIKSLYTAGLEGDDWINNLGQKYIKRNIIQAAGEGDISLDDSYSPVVPWLKGEPFNENGPTY